MSSNGCNVIVRTGIHKVNREEVAEMIVVEVKDIMCYLCRGTSSFWIYNSQELVSLPHVPGESIEIGNIWIRHQLQKGVCLEEDHG